MKHAEQVTQRLEDAANAMAHAGASLAANAQQDRNGRWYVDADEVACARDAAREWSEAGEAFILSLRKAG